MSALMRPVAPGPLFVRRGVRCADKYLPPFFGRMHALPQSRLVDERVVNFVCRNVNREMTQMAPRQSTLSSILL